MGVKVASSSSPFLQWTTTQPIVHQCSSPSQTLPSKRRRSIGHDDARFLSCRFAPQRLMNRSALLGTNLHRSKSCDLWESSSSPKPIRRVCSASLDPPFSDEEFSKKIQELTLRFNVPNQYGSEPHDYKANSIGPPWNEMVHLSSIEMKANSVDLPLSLRIIKKKRQWEEGVKQVGESACCSMNKAFSSMVFMIRELQSFTLHMREVLFYEDLQEILLRVREELHQSFVWLFQQVFSATPTLMVYVMILLANFTVYSIGSNSALAAPLPQMVTEVTTVSETDEATNVKLDSSIVKTFFVSTSTNGNTTSVGGNNNGGGGGNIKPVLSGTDGGDGFDGSEQFRTIIPEGVSQLSSSSFGSTTTESEPSVSGQDENRLWNSMVEEADRMQYSDIDDSLDHDTRTRFVSSVEARVEAEEDTDHFKTELMYQTGLSQEPNNPLLLANYAQFLYLVSNDHDRAEEYFKRAVGVEPKDAEALSKYATFLWRARDDLWMAEETFLEAIDADPTNSYYAANYANFLWNTGGDDTCFPLDDEAQEDTI
ncbi:PREDICTED: uncharacterized protein LOC104700532 [Camelina sativa]|uniref:Uncharacterized protein LOC104700532 n=1 Tax=Camelina sativa TaxID=90675 RepID=A0ABM0SPU3_CAMSA|nr:PREDICTED: uncharacterized protein LOC104700532 [Camelina sativa]